MKTEIQNRQPNTCFLHSDFEFWICFVFRIWLSAVTSVLYVIGSVTKEEVP